MEILRETSHGVCAPLVFVSLLNQAAALLEHWVNSDAPHTMMWISFEARLLWSSSWGGGSLGDQF